jgi:hypothetical protein
MKKLKFSECISDTNDLTNGQFQKINILYENCELLNEDNLLQESVKISNILSAKKEFNERKDIIFYISADDLIKIQQIKTNIHIRLNLNESGKLHSPKKSYSPPIRESPRKGSRRSHSASMPFIDKPKLYGLVESISKYKGVKIGNITYTIHYLNSDESYGIFMVNEKEEGVLECKGLLDREINCFDYVSYKQISVQYLNTDFQIMIADIINIKFPIIVTSAHNYKIGELMNMLEVILFLMQFKNDK